MRQDWGGFEPEERSKAGMQALSPTHNPYSATNALESRGSGASPNPPDLGACVPAAVGRDANIKFQSVYRGAR